MPSIYYIDGYNVIYHSSLLKRLAVQSFEAARDALVEKVSRFCVATGHRARIVFDGRGRHARPAGGSETAPGVEIAYSPGHQTADTLIERMVCGAADRRAIVVVSGDRGIRDLCQSMNSLVMSPDNFLATVREAIEDTRATIRNVQRPDTLQRLENRLDQAALERLQEHKRESEG